MRTVTLKILSKTRLAIALLLAMVPLSFTSAACQDKKADNVESAKIQEKGKDDTAKKVLTPSALQIMKEAAKRQGGGDITKNPTGFEADFETEFFNKEEGRINYTVKRIFVRPEYLWTKKNRDNKPPTHEIYNGEDAWFIEPNGSVIIYTQKPSMFETDIANMERDVQVTSQMLKFFFVSSLQNEIKKLKRSNDAEAPFTREECYLIEGKTMGWIGGDKKTTVLLSIYVNKKSYEIRVVRMIDLAQNTNGSSRFFLFKKYCKNEQGVMTPLNISMYSGSDMKQPEMTIAIHGKKDEKKKGIIPCIWFNRKIDRKIFTCPEDKKD